MSNAGLTATGSVCMGILSIHPWPSINCCPLGGSGPYHAHYPDSLTASAGNALPAVLASFGWFSPASVSCMVEGCSTLSTVPVHTAAQSALAFESRGRLSVFSHSTG